MKLKASPLLWVSFALIVGVMGTALITPLYAIYRDAWQLKAGEVSLIYVIYMCGALFGLLFLGRMPDRIGFTRVMLWGLGLSLLGTVLSLVARNLAVLCVGRLIVGVASSMVTTSASLGLITLSKPGRAQHVAMVTGMLIAVGFGLGPLVGGAMGQWAPYPLVTAYIPPLLLGMLGLYAFCRPALQKSMQVDRSYTFSLKDCLPHLTWPHRSESTAFVLTCGLPFLTFGVFGLYATMLPLFLDALVPWHGPMVSGLAVSVILLLSAFVQVVARNWPTQWCGFGGLVCLAVSNAVLMVNLGTGSTALFVLGVLLTSIGHGMCMLAGMRMVSRLSSAGNRSGLLSTFLVIGYVGSMLPTMAMGWIADHWGMNIAVRSFCSTVIVVGIIAAVLFRNHPRVQSAQAGVSK